MIDQTLRRIVHRNIKDYLKRKLDPTTVCLTEVSQKRLLHEIIQRANSDLSLIRSGLWFDYKNYKVETVDCGVKEGLLFSNGQFARFDERLEFETKPKKMSQKTRPISDIIERQIKNRGIMTNQIYPITEIRLTQESLVLLSKEMDDYELGKTLRAFQIADQVIFIKVVETRKEEGLRSRINEVEFFKESLTTRVEQVVDNYLKAKYADRGLLNVTLPVLKLYLTPETEQKLAVEQQVPSGMKLGAISFDDNFVTVQSCPRKDLEGFKTAVGVEYFTPLLPFRTFLDKMLKGLPTYLPHHFPYINVFQDKKGELTGSQVFKDLLEQLGKRMEPKLLFPYHALLVAEKVLDTHPDKRAECIMITRESKMRMLQEITQVPNPNMIHDHFTCSGRRFKVNLINDKRFEGIIFEKGFVAYFNESLIPDDLKEKNDKTVQDLMKDEKSIQTKADAFQEMIKTHLRSPLYGFDRDFDFSAIRPSGSSPLTAGVASQAILQDTSKPLPCLSDKLDNSMMTEENFGTISGEGCIKLNNKGSYDFIDISHEMWREYKFPNDEKVFIRNPTDLAISATGHRVLTSNGVSHFIPFGWIHLSWKSKEGAPHFVK